MCGVGGSRPNSTDVPPFFFFFATPFSATAPFTPTHISTHESRRGDRNNSKTLNLRDCANNIVRYGETFMKPGAGDSAGERISSLASRPVGISEACSFVLAAWVF